MDKQPLERGDRASSQNYTGLNIVLDPKALSDEEHHLGLAGQPDRQQHQAQDRPEADAQAARPDLQGRGRGAPDHQPAGVAATETYPKTYYVGDLVMPPGKPASNPSRPESNYRSAGPDPDATSQPASRRRRSRWPTAPTSIARRQRRDGTDGDRPKVDMTPLIQLITTSIAPGTWQVNDPSGRRSSAAYGMGGGFGGGDAGGLDTAQPIGSITPFFLSISLIIRHTAEVHDQVADLLRQLRRLQDLQVSIEVRFITVSDNFFEQIGVDFDFQIQSKAVGKHSTFAVPNPATSLVHRPRRRTAGGTAAPADDRRAAAARPAASAAAAPAAAASAAPAAAAARRRPGGTGGGLGGGGGGGRRRPAAAAPPAAAAAAAAARRLPATSSTRSATTRSATGRRSSSARSGGGHRQLHAEPGHPVHRRAVPA